MSLVDYLAPIILCACLGLAAVLGVSAWIALRLLPGARELAKRRQVTTQTLDYNRRARELVDCIVGDKLLMDSLHPNVQDLAWQLAGINDRETRGISR